MHACSTEVMYNSRKKYSDSVWENKGQQGQCVPLTGGVLTAAAFQSFLQQVSGLKYQA